MNLKIARELALPIDGATQTFAFLGRRGSGKTYAAGVLIERMLDAKIQVVVLDTVGNWYGLRLAADGKAAGYDIPVLGGLRGDIPLEESAGALIANTLIDTGRSAVLDISQFSLSARQRFAAAFGEKLWQRKKADRHPAPLHLALEECQLIIPQNVKPDQARMVGVYEEIVRLGRNYGIGASMISQRPQSVNKEVLNQTECLLVFQTNGAHEREALKKWIVAQGADIDLVQSLPSLPIGTAYVWSPQWLQIFKKVTIAEKSTYDASATPRVGDKRPAARELAPLNLEDLHEKMKEVVERAQVDDPRALRKKISELEKELKLQALRRTDIVVPPPPAIPKHQLDELFAIVKEHEGWTKRLAHLVVNFGKVHKQVGKHIVSVPYGSIPVVGANGQVRGWSKPRVRVDPSLKPGEEHLEVSGSKPLTRVVPPGANGHEKLSSGERKVLTVLAQHTETGRSRRQLALQCVYAPKGGGFNNILSALRTRGLIVGDQASLCITDAGLNALGPVEPLPTDSLELLRHWQRQLGRAERVILTELCAAYPKALTKSELGERTEYEPNGGGFNNALSRLRTLELIEGKGELRASEELFG